MDGRIEELLAGAFHVAPAREANMAIARARRERAGGDPDDDDAPTVRSYEIILDDWRTFAESQLPKLVYHLESIGAFLPDCRGVMISAFAGDRLHFIDASIFVAAAARLAGLSHQQLSDRYGTHERRTAVREPVLLPPPKGEN